jgi:membrane protein
MSEERNSTKHWYSVFFTIKDALSQYIQEGAFFHGAALAYYTLFAFVPIVYLTTSIFGRIFGQKNMENIVIDLLKNRIGISNTDDIMNILHQVNFDRPNIFLEALSILVLLYGCSAFFVSLKRSINEFFDISRKKRHEENILMDLIGFRFLSVAYLGVFALIIILLYFSQTFAFSILEHWIKTKNGFVDFSFSLLQYIISILSNLLIFIVVFKYIHDGTVPWKIALNGAFVTSIFLFISQLIIKYYLINYFFLGNLGIVGSLFIILAWVNYSAQIVFCGAKYTAVLAKKNGIVIK